MNYFTADTHFGDRRLFESSSSSSRSCKRPFRNIHAMNYALPKKINRVVSERDNLYIVGDVAHNCSVEFAKKILRSLKCTLHLVVGNHDVPYLADGEFCDLFATITDKLELSYNGITFYLTHEFDNDWQPCGSIQLYGHFHYARNSEQRVMCASFAKGAYNVGVDFNNYFPVSAEKICKRAFADFMIGEITTATQNVA